MNHMSEIFDHIKNYQLSPFGLGGWGVWLVLLFAAITVTGITRVLTVKGMHRVARLVTIIFYVLSGCFALLVLMHLYLNAKYFYMSLMVFLMSLPELKKLIGKLYHRYDAYMEKRFEK